MVVDEPLGALALGYLPDLRAGERSVEEHDARSALGRGEHRLQKAPVVPREDRDAVTRLEPTLAPRVGDCVRVLVKLLVAELAPLVDHRSTIAVPDRSDRHGTAQHPKALERERHLGEAVGWLQPDHAASDAQRREIRLVARSLRELESSLEQLPRIQIHFVAPPSCLAIHLTHFCEVPFVFATPLRVVIARWWGISLLYMWELV